MNKEISVKFRTGKWVSALPMIFFVVWAITLCLSGAPDMKGLILGAIIGLTLAMFFVKDSWSLYCDEIFEGMRDSAGAISIVCWFWAGMFAQILRIGGLVEGLVWLGKTSGFTGGLFTGATFLLSALFATAVGTGYGTTVAFCTLMYPAGILLGADPVFLFGAILSGAAFGDNLAPVSDTTIVSAVTQGADVPGVVKSRFKYAILAALPALAIFMVFGGVANSASIPVGNIETLMNATLSPNGLILLIPFALVIILALSGKHIITSITIGIMLASVMILLLGLAPASSIFHIDVSKQTAGGALIDGFVGYLEVAALFLFILAAGHIMKVGGAMESILSRVFRFAGTSLRRAELSIWSIVASFNFFITSNTAAEIAAAPFVKEIGSHFKIHPYRRANMLDSITSALGYIFPWSGGVLIGYATITMLAKDMPWLTVIPPTKVWPYVFHGWFLVTIMLISAITGFGRELESEQPTTVSEEA